MKRSIRTALPLILFILIAGQVSAAPTWCSQNPGAIFCFDFDRACVSPPPPPEACPDDADRYDPAIRGVWRYNSWNYNTNKACGSNMIGEELVAILPSDPYGGRHANGGDEGGNLGQNTVDLTTYIQAAMPGKTTANGTDQQPLVLTFTMGALAYHKLQFNNGYLELSLGDQTGRIDDPAKAPTDYVLVGADNGTGCFNCNAMCNQAAGESASDNPWPTICQQEFPHPLCPPKQTFVRNTLAIGALAMLDNNPCHCCSALPLDPNYPSYARQCIQDARTPDFPDGFQEPTNIHLAYFDGLEWRILRAGMGGPGSYGDFRYGNYNLWGVNKNAEEGYETVVLTIKTNTVDVYHKTKMLNLVEGRWVETWAESLARDLPRRYTGAFNRLRAGTDESCVLNNAAYTCNPAYTNGKKKCKVMKEDTCTSGIARSRSSYVSFDNVKLSGGSGGIQIGACCKNNATCVETDWDTCENVLHGHYQGPTTACAATSCCPYPFADADLDGDVDQDDLGIMQICYTGQGGGTPIGCECLDRNDKDEQGGDDAIGDIDVRDIGVFEQCRSGPNVPAVPPPPGCSP